MIKNVQLYLALVMPLGARHCMLLQDMAVR